MREVLKFKLGGVCIPFPSQPMSTLYAMPVDGFASGYVEKPSPEPILNMKMSSVWEITLTELFDAQLLSLQS